MRALGFDTETTDLIRSKFRPLKDQPHITEFFGLVLETFPTQMVGESFSLSWAEKGSYHSLFNPGVALSAEVMKITGLKDSDLREQPPFKDKAEEVKQLIESCDIIFAHNLGFDRAMIDIEMRRAGLTVDWAGNGRRMICTVEATEHFKGRRLKLIELHEHLFGEQFENAHRAENDVRPMVRCFKKLWEMGTI